MAIPQSLNGTELSREKFQDNLLLRCGIVPLNLPTDYGGCVKRLSVPHNLSCPKGGLVIAHHKDASKEWGALSARSLNPSCIFYGPKIYSMAIHGDRDRAGSWIATGSHRGQGAT